MAVVDDKDMTDRELAERGKVRMPDGSVGTSLQARLANTENLVGVADHPLAIRYDQPVFPTAVTGTQAVEIVIVEDKESGFDDGVASAGAAEQPGSEPRTPTRVRR